MCGRIMKGKGTWSWTCAYLWSSQICFKCHYHCNYTHAPTTNGETLRARLRRCQLLTHWSSATISTSVEDTTPSPCFNLYTTQCCKPTYAAEVTFSVTVYTDLTWTLKLGSLPVLPSQVSRAPIRLLNVPEVLSLLETLDSVRLCVGNPEDQYLKLVEEKGPFMDKTSIWIIMLKSKTMKIMWSFN